MKALIAAGALALSAGAAQAQACFDHGQVADALARDGMTLYAAPIVTGPSVMGMTEIYVGPSGQWVMLVIGPSGEACLLFLGEGWFMGEAT